MTRMPAMGHPPPYDLALESERLFLLDLLDSPDGTAAMVSAPKPYDRKPFKDGGKWRGDIPKELARKRIIVRVKPTTGAEVESASRPTRNGTCIRRWRLIDRAAALRRLEELNARLMRRRERTLFDDVADEPAR